MCSSHETCQSVWRSVNDSPMVVASLIKELKSLTLSTTNMNVLAALESDMAAYEPLLTELKQHLDKEGGEVVLVLDESAASSTDTRVVVNVPFSRHEACKVLLGKASELVGACCMQQMSYDKTTVLLVRNLPQSVEDHIEVRIAIMGNVDAGKSTLLGVLTKGGLDDGRGRARVDLFRHKHEIESGRTSSVGSEVMGFQADGKPVVEVQTLDEPIRKIACGEVCAHSAKVISFIDLAGHERYLKTTVFGMTSGLPDYVILMVGANAGLVGMSKEHLGIALALSIPVAVVVTKVDMCPPQVLETTMQQLNKVLQSPGCRKTCILINSAAQAIDVALQLPVKRICPIFQISNVTGERLDLLRLFLNLLPSSQAKFAPLRSAPVEMPINDVFSVPFVGTVVSGVLKSGVVKTGDSLLLGPDSLGQFTVTSVRSIHRKRINVECASAGQSVCFALKRVRRNQVRKGMLLISQTSTPPVACQEFEAEVLCLYHSTTLSVGSCIVLHASSVRQTVKIMAINKLDAAKQKQPQTFSLQAADDAKPVLRMGDRARVQLRFMSKTEYLTPGTKLIAREGKTKLVGIVRTIGNQDVLASGAGPRYEDHKSSTWRDNGNGSKHLAATPQLSGAA